MHLVMVLQCGGSGVLDWAEVIRSCETRRWWLAGVMFVVVHGGWLLETIRDVRALRVSGVWLGAVWGAVWLGCGG